MRCWQIRKRDADVERDCICDIAGAARIVQDS